MRIECLQGTSIYHSWHYYWSRIEGQYRVCGQCGLRESQGNQKKETKDLGTIDHDKPLPHALDRRGTTGDLDD